jgi:hypothetical protein
VADYFGVGPALAVLGIGTLLIYLFVRVQGGGEENMARAK